MLKKYLIDKKGEFCMKKLIIPIIIINLTLISGCKWFCKKYNPDKKNRQIKTTITSPKNLKSQLANISKQIKEKTILKANDLRLINLQKQIQEKAKFASMEIKKIIQNNALLKEINNQIIEKRKNLNNNKMEQEERLNTVNQTKELIARFKNNQDYKKTIKPLEEKIKEFSIKYNKIAIVYHNEIQQLNDKKRNLIKQIKITKKNTNQKTKMRPTKLS